MRIKNNKGEGRGWSGTIGLGKFVLWKHINKIVRQQLLTDMNIGAWPHAEKITNKLIMALINPRLEYTTVVCPILPKKRYNPDQEDADQQPRWFPGWQIYLQGKMTWYYFFTFLHWMGLYFTFFCRGWSYSKKYSFLPPQFLLIHIGKIFQALGLGLFEWVNYRQLWCSWVTLGKLAHAELSEIDMGVLCSIFLAQKAHTATNCAKITH